MKTRIPGIEEFQGDDQEVRDKDKDAKERGRLYADEKRGARVSDVKERDKVLLKQEKKDKLTPTFRQEPFHVLEKAGKSVVVESSEGVKYKRNSTHVKKFVESDGLPEEDFLPYAGAKYSKEIVEPVVTPAEIIPEPDPNPVQRPVRTKALPVRFEDFVMYYINDKDTFFFNLEGFINDFYHSVCMQRTLT